jgi:hypothetical protein
MLYLIFVTMPVIPGRPATAIWHSRIWYSTIDADRSRIPHMPNSDVATFA